MAVLKGDFIGFTFGGVHSSTLGMVRVSGGSRYDENLLPSFQDKTSEVFGREETFLFGTSYSKRDLTVKIAFDSITEEQIRGIRQLFGDQQVKDLIFDEAPYRSFRAKVGQNLVLNYICFDQSDARVYKGEGTIAFTCYNPFAFSRYKFLDEYANSSPSSITVPEWVNEEELEKAVSPEQIAAALNFYNNKSQWGNASGMAASKSSGPYDVAGTGRQNILLLNPGDRETDIIITLRGTASGAGYLYDMKIGLSTDTQSRIIINNTTSRNTDTENPNYEEPLDANEIIPEEYIQINTRNNLIEGVNKVGDFFYKTGNIYNQYLTAGIFFKIPIITIGQNGMIVITDSLGGTSKLKGYIDNIDYKYLYY